MMSQSREWRRQCHATRPREDPNHWSRPRVFRLGFLAGRGFTAADIAKDPVVATTEREVHALTRDLGGALSDGPRGTLMIDLPGPLLRDLRTEARRRRQAPERLAGTAMRILLADPTLLANVLDDEA